MRTGLVVMLTLCALACADTGPELPHLRIVPRAPGPEFAYPAHFIVEGASARWELGYRPEDGGPRRRKAESGEIPWPAGLSKNPTLASAAVARLDRPALVLRAAADTLWNDLVRAAPGDAISDYPRLFLGGQGPDDEVVQLPFRVAPPTLELALREMGGAMMPCDLTSGVEPVALLEIRITREDRKVRYRWGHWPTPGLKWGDGGDRTFADADVQGLGEGPLLPALGEFLTVRDTKISPPFALVLLSADDEVRYVDVLRAVECAGGDPAVCFFPDPIDPWGPERLLELPRARTWEEPLHDRPGEGRRVIVNCTFDRRLLARGIEWEGRELRKVLEGYPRVLIRADRRLRWEFVRAVVGGARQAGAEVELCFAPERSGLPREGELLVPTPAPDEITVRIAPERDDRVEDIWNRILEQRVAGRGVILE